MSLLDIPVIEEVNLEKDLPKLKKMLKDYNVKRLAVLVGKGNKFNEVLYCTTQKKDFEKKKLRETSSMPEDKIKTKILKNKGFFGCILEEQK